MFKFFSTKKMLPGHIKALRRSRRVLASEKVLTYDNGSFFEHSHFEKAVYVLMPNDPILKELDALEIAENGDYDYSSVSPVIKRYMRLKDDEFFNKAYSEWKNSDRFKTLREEREIERIEEHYERGLFSDELETILSGDKVKFETSSYIKAKKSNRRAYKTVLELIRANLETFESFITLTFALKEHELKYLEKGVRFDLVDDATEFENVKDIFSDFMKNFAQKLRRNGHEFEYIAVYEEHKDGRYHFHLISSKIPDEFLVECPEWLDVDFKTGQRRNGLMIADWLHGKSDIAVIKDKEKMSSYLCKYLVKNFMVLEDNEETYNEFFGKKKYFRSKGLKKPNVEYFTGDDSRELELIEKRKAEYTDIYSTRYKNPYNDSEIEKTICSKKNIS